ncbi:MAG TPA: GspH/FimT family pseudopilin [Candidatus Limnocylindria bacterium]|jgi:type II secretion system protein H|nr:GspH/FimT family pseudopilin [Candidatus Limnocylindria bacterium]
MRLAADLGTKTVMKGFTLIELILVLTILAIAVAMSAPMLAAFFRGRALDSEARRLLSLSRAGQSRAVSDGMPVLLWIDSSRGSYGIEEEMPSKGNDAKATEFSLDSTLRLEAPNAAPVAVNRRKLPAVRFLPDGTIDESSPVALKLLASDGSMLWLVAATNRLFYAIQYTR